MRPQACAFLAAALIGASLCGVAGAAALPEKVGDTPVPSLAPIVKKVSPAVVNIATRGTLRETRRNPVFDDPIFRRFFEPQMRSRQRTFQSAGSGVIVDARNGYVVTNAHVIENADEITVTLLDDRQTKAKVVGRDRPSDVAVLKIDLQDLTDMPLADSSKAEVGDFVFTIGNPFALNHTVTSGIISALGRSQNTPDVYQDFIQTDAPINFGNSGGALVNLYGQLVGINSAIFSGSGGNIGIGFAIPSNMVKSVMAQIVQHGQVRRGRLGFDLEAQFTPEIAESLGLDNARGALVSRVATGSAAERAGIKAGDVITSINGRTMNSSSELRNAIGLLQVGEKVELALLRDAKPRRVTAIVAEREEAGAAAAAEIHPALDGAVLATADNNAGVLVRSVAVGSPAAFSGLRPNDVIVQVGRAPIGNLEQLRQTLQNSQSFAVRIRRGEANVVLTIR
jgi:Do/DeqQ family serine protease